MTKEKVIETVNSLPEHFDLDVLMERLLFIENVEKGLTQIKNGQVISHEEVKKMVVEKKRILGISKGKGWIAPDFGAPIEI